MRTNKMMMVVAFLILGMALAACGGSDQNGGSASSVPAANNSSAPDLLTQGELSGTPAEICDAILPVGEPATRDYRAPEQVLEPGVDYRAVFCTEAGAIYVDLYESQTPLTVNNFVFLAQRGYFNNTMFHRVLANFMAQGGDPTATGSGGPGYRFEDEFLGFLHFDTTGQLAMANAGPGTNGSQFFITTSAPDWLNYNHTIFGEVLEGYENVINLRLRDPQQSNPSPGSTLQTVVIIDNPAAVTTSWEAPPLASQEDIAAAVEEAAGFLAENIGFGIVDGTPAMFDTDELAAIAPDDLQGNVQQFLTEHNHVFTALIAHETIDCDLNNAPFMGLGYMLSAFETPADAAAALEDTAVVDFAMMGAVDQVYEATMTPNLPNVLYVVQTSACDRDAVQARTYWQRGRFLVVASITLPIERQGEAGLWLEQVVTRRVYENVLSDVLRPEIYHR